MGLKHIDESIGKAVPGVKAGVKVTEAVKTVASLSKAISLVLAENVKYKTQETTAGLRRLGSEVFENMADLKDDGIDVVSIIAFTSGMTSAIIDYYQDNIREDEKDWVLSLSPKK